jgi:hypothetical protein
VFAARPATRRVLVQLHDEAQLTDLGFATGAFGSL